MNPIDTYAQQVHANAPAVPITLITTIIQSILSILAQCKPAPTGKTLKDAIDSRPLLATRAINKSLREHGIRPLGAQGKQLKQGLLTTANAAPLETLDAFAALAK